MIGEEKQEAILRHFIRYQIAQCESKLGRYLETDQSSYLDEAIQISRASLNMTRHSVTEPSLLMILSKSLLHRYVVMGMVADLRDAVSTADLAVTAIPEGNPNPPSYIRHLGDALNQVYTPTGPSNYHEEGWRQASLAIRLYTIYKRNGVVALLQEAIRLALVEVAATPDGHPKRPGMLDTLGTFLYTRFERYGELEDLREAILLGGEAVAATPIGHPDRAGVVGNQGTRLYARFNRNGALEDLQEAIRLSEEAVDATPVDHRNYASMCNNLGTDLFTRFNRTGALEVLQEAIRRTKEAVAATPVDDPNRAGRLNNLGNRLSARFDRTGSLEDLQEAIRRSEEAVAATPVDHPDRAMMLNNLGKHLSTRFDRTGALEDLQEAIRRSEEAVAATPVDHPDRAGRMNNLGNRLSTRFDRTGALEDLQEAIRWGEEAVAATPMGHPDRAGRINNLGNCLSTRFDRTGALEDLQEAIRLSEETADATPVGHPNRTKMLDSLGKHLSARFGRTGALKDLQEAIRRTEEAVAATPVDSPDRAGRLNNLGRHLSTRFDRTRALEDLQEAIRRSEEAVAATPVDHPLRAGRLSDLGARLSTRFDRIGELEDLQNAIHRAEEAVAATPVDHPNRARMLASLGKYLSSRFDRTKALEDLQEAICLSEKAVDATPVDHPHYAMMLNNLGNRLLTRFDKSNNSMDFEKACIAWETAAKSHIAHPVVRAKSARLATQAHINLGRFPAAYSNSQSVIKLLHQASSRAIEREDQEYILGKVSGTSSLAASLALVTGEPASAALELLEFGCGIIAGYTFDARSDVSKLGKQYPALYSRYKTLQDELSSPLQVPEMECHAIPSMASTRNRITRRLKAVHELDELEAEIRGKDGFSRFQLPPSSADFIALAQSIGGPIVTFSVSELLSHAIIVTQTEIKALALPRLDCCTLAENSGILSNGLMKGPKRTMPDRLNKLKDILLWLWEAAVKPVLQELNFIQHVSKHDGEPMPRIWWISNGRMGMMPIHAAGDYASNPKIIASNYVISSYTPTIKSLAYARRKVSEVRGRPGNNVLIVGNSVGTSRASSKGVLSEVPAEIKAIEQAAKGAIGTTCTIPHPHKRIVLDNLSSCNIAHFSCHGFTDPRNPCNSHLLLTSPEGTEADPLRIKELSNRNLDRSMLAYLSACHTANYTSKTLLDEAIHIASGFQLAGFPHVIGTLWEANDLKAREVATKFYEILFDSLDSGRGFEDGIVAEALHKAVASLRKEFEDNPILWAPFIHLGA